MRRMLLLPVGALLFAALTFAPAAHAGEGPATPTTEPAVETEDQVDVPGHSIVGRPDEEKGSNNLAGLLVGIVLLGGWMGVGGALYLQARRRRPLPVERASS